MPTAVLLWLRFDERQDMRTLFAGLEETFRFFGGVTREVLFDRMKAVITADLRLRGGRLVVNEEFLRFAVHWGFRPRGCRAYRAQTKGKVGGQSATCVATSSAADKASNASASIVAGERGDEACGTFRHASLSFVCPRPTQITGMA